MAAPRLAVRAADFESPGPFAEGLASLNRGDVESGYARLREASARYPRDPRGPGFAGMVEFQSGRYTNAIESFSAASGFAPGVSAYSCNEGLARLMAGQSAAAFDAFLRSLHGDEILLEAHRFAWTALDGMGKREGATRALKAALGCQPVARADAGPRLPTVTLCAIDCVDPPLAARSLRRSMSHARFGAVKLLTSFPLREPGIESVPISPITSLAEYSRFVMKRLADYIDTDFALVTQWDGHVINASAWDDDFLDFDYIGGVWDRQAIGDNPCNVGNGGFSLRSTDFLQAGGDPGITQVHPEDVHLCRTYREHLERRHGIVFADEATAHRFSFEAVIRADVPFGFHGLMNVCCFEPDPRFVKFDFLRMP